jgi:hypothetical protein
LTSRIRRLTSRSSTWQSLIAVAVAAACLLVAPAIASSSTLEEGSNPGTAFGGSSTMTCFVDTGSQQRAINCTVTASAGNLHFVRVNNINLGNTFVVSSKLPCKAGGLGGSGNLNFRAPTGNKYRVTVADCAGDKDVYKVDQNGNVTVISSVIVGGI